MRIMTNFLKGMSFSRIEDIERRLFYYLCGMSFFLPLSIAAGNIFLTLALLGLAHRLIRKRDDVAEKLRRYSKIFWTILALLLAVFISALGSNSPLTSTAKFIERYIYHMAILFPVFLVNFQRAQVIFLMKCLMAGVFISNMAVIAQALPNLERKYWRFSGFLEIMPQGSLLAMFLPIYALLFMHFKKRRLIGAGVLILAVAALILNGTRGAWLTALILIPVTVLLYSRQKLKALAVMLGVLVLIGSVFAASPRLSGRLATITNMNMQSNAERLKMWQSAFHMFEDHPLFGIGYGDYAAAYQNKYILPDAKEPKQTHSHNNLIQMLAECGIVGAGAFLFMWIYFSYFSLRGWFRERNFVCLMFFTILSGMMLHGLTEFNFETAVTGKILWYSLGLCLAYSRFENS